MPYRNAILHRTISFENKKGRFRRTDWNLVNTPAGGGHEPVYLDDLVFEAPPAAIDLDDDINRVDKIRMDGDGRVLAHSDDHMGLIGGFSKSLGRSTAYIADGAGARS